MCGYSHSNRRRKLVLANSEFSCRGTEVIDIALFIRDAELIVLREQIPHAQPQLQLLRYH